MDDLIRVTKNEFYDRIGPLDVVLDVNRSDKTFFNMRYGGLVGVTSGWKHTGEKEYWLTRRGKKQ